MDNEPRQRSPLPIVATVVVLLLAAYVGTYFAMVHAVSLRFGGGGPVFPVYSIGGYLDAIQKFMERSPGNRDPLETVFAPIHWIDYRLRPHIWNP